MPVYMNQEIDAQISDRLDPPDNEDARDNGDNGAVLTALFHLILQMLRHTTSPQVDT